MTTSLGTLLIYLPCHTDYEMAITKARNLKEKSKGLRLEVEIFISINGVTTDKDLIANLLAENAHLRVIKENLGPDLNICLGFIDALNIRPDFLWIVSANEELTDSCLEYIEQMLQSQEADIYVACLDRNGSIVVDDILMQMPKKSSLGLITSSIYRFDSFKGSFHQALNYAWTGWGHLSVIQSQILKSKIVIYEFQDKFIYKKPIVFIPSENKGISEIAFIRAYYMNSFYGLPLLFMYLFSTNRRYLRLQISKWLFSNWKYLNYFGKVKDNNNEYIKNNNARLFFVELRNLSFILYLIAFIGRNVNLFKLRSRLIWINNDK